MESERCRRGLKSRHGLALAISLALGMLAPGAGAQELGDLAGKAKLSDAERAKRDGDKVMQWIRFHADKADRPVRPAAPKEAQAAAKDAAKDASARDASANREAAQRAAAVRSAAAAARPAASEAAQPLAAAVPAPELAASSQLMAAASPSVQPVLLPPAAQVARAPEPTPPAEEVPLRLLERVEPEFPLRLVRERSGGSVMVRFTVQPDGTVRAAEAINASNKRLVPAVLEAVGRWRFAPIPETRVAVVEVGYRPE